MKYHVQLGDPILENGQVKYPVVEVFLTGDTPDANRFQCTDCGKTETNWISQNRFDFIRDTHLGPVRARALKNFMEYVLWHEKRHEIHQKAVLSRVQDIVNNPVAPAVVGSVDEAIAAVKEDRQTRAKRVVQAYNDCTKAFHDTVTRTPQRTTNRFEDVMLRCIERGDCNTAEWVDWCIQNPGQPCPVPDSLFDDSQAQCNL